MNLLYITFGGHPAVHEQAAFSIYSFLAQPSAVHSIHVLTDNEKFYTHLGNHVNIITISPALLKEWKGEHDFFWRVKIKAIEKICKLHEGGPVMYLDTDTFLYNDIGLITDALKKGNAIMHENEGPLSMKKSKTEQKMWGHVAGKTFGGAAILPTNCMWNAGVVATPNTNNGSECTLALTICDEMCQQGVTKRLIEQLALSVALENTYGLKDAKNAVAHYWSAKEVWNKKINDFFMEAYFARWDDATILSQITTLDKTNLPIFYKSKNTNLRLKLLIDKMFPDRDFKYL